MEDKEQKTVDDFVPPVRYYKGQKKTDLSSAPWSGSRFEAEYGEQEKLSEYTGGFQRSMDATRDCREKPIIPISDANEWMIGNRVNQMELTTTNTATFPPHATEQKAPLKVRRDHTNTFCNKAVAIKDSTTYTRSYFQKPDATRPKPFCPGPPENIIAADLEHKFPNSVNCETYRQYERQEQAGARRAPIVLMPEFGKIPVVKSPVDAKHFATSYSDDFEKHGKYKRATPLRPEENGIHYDLNSKPDLTTTHDRTFNSRKFPAERKLQRSEPVGGPNQLVTTMMSDFKLKTISNPAQPFLPPVGLSEEFGTATQNSYTTGYEQAFASPDLKKIMPVTNCKPVHQYKPPTEKMECQSTAHTHFTGKSCPPATSCKPKLPERQL